MRIPKLPGLARGALWIGSLQAIRVLLSLVGMGFVLRRYSPEVYGLLAIGIAAAEISMACIFVVQGAVQVFASRMLAAKDHTELGSMLWAAYALRFGSSVVVSLVMFAIAAPMSAFYRHPELLPILSPLAFTTLARAVDGPVETNVLFVQKAYPAIFHTGLLETLGLFFVNSCAFAFNWRPETYALGYMLCWMPRNIVFWMIGWQFHRRYGLGFQPHVFESWLSRICRFGFWHTGTTFLNVAGINGGTLVIGRALGPSTAAIYAVAVTLLRRLIGVVSAPDTMFLSRISEAGLDSARRMMERTLTYFSAFGLFAAVCAAGIIAFAPEFMNALGGATYQASTPLLQLFAVVVLIRSAELARHMAYAMEKTQHLFWITSIRTTIEYGVLALAAVFGSLSIAATSVIVSASVSTLGIVWVASKATQDPLKWLFFRTMISNVVLCAIALELGAWVVQALPAPWSVADTVGRALILSAMAGAMAAVFGWTYFRRRGPFRKLGVNASP